MFYICLLILSQMHWSQYTCVCVCTVKVTASWRWMMKGVVCSCECWFTSLCMTTHLWCLELCSFSSGTSARDRKCCRPLNRCTHCAVLHAQPQHTAPAGDLNHDCFVLFFKKETLAFVQLFLLHKRTWIFFFCVHWTKVFYKKKSILDFASKLHKNDII